MCARGGEIAALQVIRATEGTVLHVAFIVLPMPGLLRLQDTVVTKL